MYEIKFFKDKNGNQPVLEYIKLLSSSRSKNSRIKLNKIQEYIEILSLHGKNAGQPYIKHIDDEIWELRPIRDRIFFIAWEHDSFILLHQFQKKTQKTPQREINQAKKELEYLKEELKNE